MSFHCNPRFLPPNPRNLNASRHLSTVAKSPRGPDRRLGFLEMEIHGMDGMGVKWFLFGGLTSSFSLLKRGHSCFHDPMLNPRHSFPRIKNYFISWISVFLLSSTDALRWKASSNSFRSLRSEMGRLCGQYDAHLLLYLWRNYDSSNGTPNDSCIMILKVDWFAKNKTLRRPFQETLHWVKKSNTLPLKRKSKFLHRMSSGQNLFDISY